jgi:hypothetical protein
MVQVWETMIIFIVNIIRSTYAYIVLPLDIPDHSTNEKEDDSSRP